MKFWPDGWFWTTRQRDALAGLLVIFFLYLGWQWSQRRVSVGRPPAAVGPRADEIRSKIDLNTASVDELSAVPRLGRGKAEAIAAFREAARAAHPDRPPFGSWDDLLPIRGVGPGTIAELKSFARIDLPTTDAATTRRATMPP